MTTQRLAGVNFNAPISNNDLQFEQSQIQRELLERIKLVMGHPDWITESAWGIVANTDPTAETANSGGPLVVTDTNLSVNVTAGYAVTKSGFLIYLTATQSLLSLASTEEGAINIVTIKYSTGDPDSRSINDYDESVYKWRTVAIDEDLVVIYTQSEWEDLSPDEQNDHIPLAVVTVQADSTGSKSLSVDMTTSSYSWNRPWFSAVDVQHRGQVGSGTVSSTNAHGLSFNDLNAGDFTLPQLMLRVGAIAAKSQAIAHVPGRVCTTDVPFGNIKTDSTGGITGFVGGKYFTLPFYPVALGKVYKSTDESHEYAFKIKPRTQFIIQASSTSLVPTSEDLKVVTARVDTLEPATIGDAITSFSAGAVDSHDLVIADGLAFTSSSSVARTDALGDVGPIPMHYDFYFTASKVVKNPQVMVCRTPLSSIGSGIIPSITQFEDGVILIALDKASAGSSLSVKVRVDGKDADGVAANETFEFDSTWAQGPAVPNAAVPYQQFLRGTQVFSEISNVTLVEDLNSGADAAIQIWIVMHTTTSSGISYACPVCTGVWDGTKLVNVIDTRTIGVDLQSLMSADSAITAAATAIDNQLYVGAGSVHYEYLVCGVENFLRPQYGVLVDPSWADWQQTSGQMRTSPTDRTQLGLWGYYESRALAIEAGTAQVEIRALPYSGTAPLDRQMPFSLSVQVKLHDSVTGLWSAWNDAVAMSSNRLFYLGVLPTTVSVKIRFVGATGLLGFVLNQQFGPIT